MDSLGLLQVSASDGFKELTNITDALEKAFECLIVPEDLIEDPYEAVPDNLFYSDLEL